MGGLFQYRNMCQSTNVASLASVVQGYLTMAEKRTESARTESIDSVEVDDLENIATPEMIMLSAVSGEGAQDRSDRTILMPWVKFLWESYCQCLELLRTNSRVERLYHNIAQQAFKFCLKYQRKTEFRKLCDKLRNHLDLIIKQQNPTANTINLNNPETQQMNLDTRLVQLDAAIHMELWQEAYKAVEDIHGLMSLSKKVFQPKMMANYYQKLALVFWKSGNFLFHAAAVFKHFQLTREMKKNISTEELAKMASRVLAACLCVPLPSQHPEFDRFIETDRSPAEKMARLAVLLALSQPPTRLTLLKDCVRFGVVVAAGKELQDLYNWLEVDFHPLNLCAKVDEKLKFIDESDDFSPIKRYTEPLRDMTLVRLLKQVAQVYQSVSMKRLLSLTKFSTHHHMERLIVECARNNEMQVRIDHRTGSVHFGTDLSEAQRTDLPEGPHIQSMPSEQVRTQLMSMMSVLDKTLATIHPDRNKVESAELRQRITEAYHQSKVRDHQRLLARHKIIEERKEWLEKYNNAQQEAAIESKRKEIERQKAEEAKRLQIEREEREKQRKENEIRDIQAKHTRDKIAQLANTEIGKKVLEGMQAEEIAKMDADEIMAKQVEELEKEKKELQVRLKAQEKKVDHLERAKRLEEIPLLKLQFEEFKEEAKVVWEEQEEDRIEGEKNQRGSDVENRDRMVRMREDKDKYLDSLLKERKSMRRKRQNSRKLKERRGRKNVKSKKEWKEKERRELIILVVEMKEEVTEAVPGELEGAVEVPRGKRKDPGVEVHGEEGVVVALVELVAAGGIERRIRKISGGQEVEMNVEEMMMVLLQGAVRHLLEEVLPLGEDLLQEVVIAEPGGEEMLLQKVLLPDVEEVEMMVLQEGDHHQEEILVVKEMVVARGGPVLLEKSLEVIVLQGGVEEILVKGGVLLQGGRVTVHHQEEDLLPGEISEEMMTGEEVLHVVHLLKEELGVAVGIGLLLGEDPLLDVLLLEEALHQGVVALLPAEEAVTMDLLTGAVATVQLLLLLPLLVMNLPQLNPGQPVKNQTQAGQPSSVNPTHQGISGLSRPCQIARF